MIESETIDGKWWIHDLDPIIFQFTEQLAIRWYGLSYVVGFIIAYVLLLQFYRRGLSKIAPEKVESLFIHAIIGVMVGGRLGSMLLYTPHEFFRNPLIFFHFWDGGMASHGGFAGVLLALIIFARKNQLSILHTGDMVCAVAPPGLLLGRLANFINGELWGKPSEVAWAVVFPHAPTNYEQFHFFSESLERFVNPRHPSQLYAAFLEGLILFVYLQIRIFAGKAYLKPGLLAGEFLIGYSILRMLGEIFREPDAELLLGLSRGTFFSVFTLLGGIGVVVMALKRTKHN